MWDCIFVSGPACVPFFMATVLIGNLVILNLFLAVLLSSFSGMGEGGEEEDDEPDKMKIAFGRFGRLKRFIFGNIKKVLRNLINMLTSCCTGQKPSYGEMVEHGRENLTMDPNNPDVLLSEKISENVNKPMINGLSNMESENKESGLQSYMDKHMIFNDINIGGGMEFSTKDVISNKESSDESVHSGDSGWRRSKARKSESNTPEEVPPCEVSNTRLIEENPNVEEVFYDPVDDVVVEVCCPEVCYRVFPCCVGDPDSPMWQEWYKQRQQISK